MQLNKTWIQTAFLSTILMGSIACANKTMRSPAGSNSGGGAGSSIEAKFRLRADRLIQMIADHRGADSICSAELLQKGIEQAKITAVHKIVDPKGLCSEDFGHEACTYPGAIQLAKAKWEVLLSDRGTTEEKRSTDLLILHELYRAAGSCHDDNFKLSFKTLKWINFENDSKIPFGEARFQFGANKGQCPSGSIYSRKTKSCLFQGHCSSGLAVNPEKPAQCIDPSSGGFIHNQDCAAGYVLTELGCLPQEMYCQGKGLSATLGACIEKIAECPPGSSYSVFFKSCLSKGLCGEGLIQSPFASSAEPNQCVNPYTGQLSPFGGSN